MLRTRSRLARAVRRTRAKNAQAGTGRPGHADLRTAGCLAQDGAKWEFRWDDAGITEKERYYFSNVKEEVKRGYGSGATQRICLLQVSELDSEDEPIQSLVSKLKATKNAQASSLGSENSS